MKNCIFFAVLFCLLCMHEARSQNDSSGVSLSSFCKDRSKLKCIFFINDFDDTLTIRYGNKAIHTGYYKTNKTTGVCMPGYCFCLDSIVNEKMLYICDSKGQTAIEVNPRKNGQYIYIFRYQGDWSSEITNESLQPE